MKFLVGTKDAEDTPVIPHLRQIAPGRFIVPGAPEHCAVAVVRDVEVNLTQLAERLHVAWPGMPRDTLNRMIVETATTCADLEVGTEVKCAITVEQSYALTRTDGTVLTNIYTGIS